MRLKFISLQALQKVIEGLADEQIPYKIDYITDNTGTYEQTDYVLEIENDEFMEETK